MIQAMGQEPIEISDRQVIDKASKETDQQVPPALEEDEILTIYNEDLLEICPTYSDDIKQIMKNNDIDESILNAQVIKSMIENQVTVTKDAVEIIVQELQTEHLFQLYDQGYNIEELTVDIIAKEIQASATQAGANIVEALDQEDLPTTAKDIEALEKFKEKVEDIAQVSSVTIANMIRYKLDLTINNLYKAKHSGGPKEIKKQVSQEQISSVLKANKVDIKEETIEAAEQLINNNMEVSKDKIEEYLYIKETLEDINIDDLVKQAAIEIKKGHKPQELEITRPEFERLAKLEYDEIKEVVQDIEHIDDQVIEQTYEKNKPITIENLQQTLHENLAKAMGNQVDDREGPDHEQVEKDKTPEKIVSSKRQIEEIRLKLTLEAALKLNNKLDIKTSDLSEIVEELKIIEKQANQEVLRNMDVPETEENIEIMQKVKDHIYHIGQNKEIARGQVVEGKAEFNLEAIDKAVQEVKVKQAQATYEASWTKPEGRFGESITKVEGQLGHILEIQKIQVTTSNIKAAKSLVENNIEITPENIEEAKIVLVKIETVLHELRPAIVAQMLKEGIRPDTMEINKLIEHIHELKKDHKQDPTKKLAESILELDQSKQISPKEREGLIAVYRMLNTISKNETAAIGFLLEQSREPTLGNLFEASKYIKQIGSKTGKMDTVVDDGLGLRQGDLPANIRSLIETATQKPNELILDQWLSRITPKELKKYINLDKSLEELETSPEKMSATEISRITKQATALEKISPNTLSFLKEQKIPITIPNIYWADKIMKEPFVLGDMLKEYQEFSETPVDTSLNGKNDNQKDSSQKQDLDSILKQLQKELKDNTPQTLQASQTSKAYALGQELDQMLNVQKQISNRQDVYQIPVALHHGISNLNVYLMNDRQESEEQAKDDIRAYMSIKTENLGIIQVYMQITDQALAFEMTGETAEITSKLKKDARQLQDAIESIGYDVLGVKFSQSQSNKPIIDQAKISATLLKNRFKESSFEHII